MSATTLAIALAIGTVSNQWLVAIFVRRSKQAIPKTKPVSNVEPKAKRSFWRYAAVGVDLAILIVGIYTMWTIVLLGHPPDVTPTLRLTIQISLVVSSLAIIIAYQAHKIIYGVLDLFFR
ncbi:MAG: hypothetical protein QOF80_1582 [Verrucomicrobiota bacterium]|jgi:hypothetical protein